LDDPTCRKCQGHYRDCQDFSTIKTLYQPSYPSTECARRIENGKCASDQEYQKDNVTCGQHPAGNGNDCVEKTHGVWFDFVICARDNNAATRDGIIASIVLAAGDYVREGSREQNERC
tara:strand:- start:89 stop:442 length:354 start_codon:yes stop_codon:yes gene_type:complete